MNHHSRMAFLATLFVFATLLWHQPTAPAMEETLSPTEQTTALTVAVTDLPKSMVILNAAALPDGTWWQEWFDPDSGLAYECRRLNPIRPTDDAVRRFLRMEWPEAHDVRVANFPEAAEKLTYPTSQVWFLTGHNEDTQPAVSNEIMTSLIRLLDETRPLGDAAPEFHYQGIRMISLHGLAIHSFVRIGDDGEQYYGVSRRGLVYHMDDDGMYDTIREFDRTWPDKTPLWWGEYRADNGRILWIRELREGPDGLYIRFSFGVDDKEIGGSLAEIDEDEYTAYHQDLVFRIDDDDKNVTVTREENDIAAEEGPAAWMTEAPGVHTRAE